MARALLALALLLGGCAGTTIAPQPPTQPTPASIQTTREQLAQITADPVTAWRTGVYEVRAACHAYLNQAAARSADLSLANAGVGLSGTAAAGFLLSGGNPIGAALATGLASLGQSFLSTYQASGAIPYTGATTNLIENALDADENAAEQQLPTSIEQAASYVDDFWWWCSPGGYAQLILKSAMTAQVTATPAAVPNAPVAAPRFGAGLRPRPRIYINGQ
jgi:hypothetical protein